MPRYVRTGGKHYVIMPRDQTPVSTGIVMLVTFWEKA